MRTTRLIVAVALAAAVASRAQGFADRPIRLVVPYAPGGTTDILARALQVPMQRALGAVIVVDNRAGASGLIGTREVIRAKPDGHTLLFANNGNLAVAPLVFKGANYDGARDLTPIALVSYAAMFAVVPASLPVDDIRTFIDYAKANPVAYASAGIGSFGHLTTELFAKRAGVRMTHVPYRGQGPEITAVVAGEVQLLITAPSDLMVRSIGEKRLKLLAVTSPEPWPLAPGAPTMASVFPGFCAEIWFAIMGPRGLPIDVVVKLNASINAALQVPEIQGRLVTFGVVAKVTTPQRLNEVIGEEIARWTPVISELDIRKD